MPVKHMAKCAFSPDDITGSANNENIYGHFWKIFLIMIQTEICQKVLEQQLYKNTSAK